MQQKSNAKDHAGRMHTVPSKRSWVLSFVTSALPQHEASSVLVETHWLPQVWPPLARPGVSPRSQFMRNEHESCLVYIPESTIGVTARLQQYWGGCCPAAYCCPDHCLHHARWQHLEVPLGLFSWHTNPSDRSNSRLSWAQIFLVVPAATVCVFACCMLAVCGDAHRIPLSDVNSALVFFFTIRAIHLLVVR